MRVCWNITNRCNEQCSFCFRDTSREELSLADNLVIANKLIESGVEHIAFSGGEALLYPYIDELISYIYSSNISTTLITNTLLLSYDRLLQLSKHLDWLAIPIDSLQYIPGMRNKLHYQNVNQVLQMISPNMGLKVKINTVVTRMNYTMLNEIYQSVISRYPIIERWNLFEFSPLRDTSEENKYIFEIDSQIDNIVESWLHQLNAKHSKLSIKYKHQYTLENAYVVIAPNGDVVSNSTTHHLAGNLLYDSVDRILSNLKMNESIYLRRTADAPILII